MTTVDKISVGKGGFRGHTIEKGNEDDEGDGVEVLQEVVGGAVEGHFAGLRDEVVPDLDPADEVEGEEEEDLT
jgi:hypothetical protein